MTGCARCLVALAFGLLAWPVVAGPRVVSINLCADQLLLSLADPEQILGLSPFARDASRSWAARQAEAFPSLSGTAEDVLRLKPDLVLAGLFSRQATREFLRGHGVRVVDLAVVNTIEEARQQLLDVGALLGHAERAEAAVAVIDAAIRRAKARVGPTPLRVLPLARRGWVFGDETLIGSLLGAAGLRSGAGEFGPGSAHQVRLEAVVAARPDMLLTFGSERADDQGSALLQHPALAGQYPAERRVHLPERLATCGGPMLGEAIDRLVEAKEPRP